MNEVNKKIVAFILLVFISILLLCFPEKWIYEITEVGRIAYMIVVSTVLYGILFLSIDINMSLRKNDLRAKENTIVRNIYLNEKKIRILRFTEEFQIHESIKTEEDEILYIETAKDVFVYKLKEYVKVKEISPINKHFNERKRYSMYIDIALSKEDSK